MRACVRAAATGAKEALKWSMPALVQGRILVMYGGFQRHIGFFPTAKVVSAFKKDLAKYKTGRGSIQFPYDKPLPTALIRRMVKTRVLENRERSGTWRP
jgi:uncharacterized protein YdhG (YjbR/CyaY superfamily)